MTIRVPVGLAHQKWMLTLKKSVKFFEKNRCLSTRAVAELANIDKEIVRQILHEKSMLEDGAENPHS
jgi:hypothetical protein